MKNKTIQAQLGINTKLANRKSSKATMAGLIACSGVVVSLAIGLMIIPLHALAETPEDVYLNELFGVEVEGEGEVYGELSTNDACEAAKASLSAAQSALRIAETALQPAKIALAAAETADSMAEVAQTAACIIPFGSACSQAKAKRREAARALKAAQKRAQSAEQSARAARNTVAESQKLVNQLCS